VQRGGGSRRVQLGEAPHRAIRRRALDLDASLLQAVEHLRTRPHPLVRAGPDDQSLGELVGHVLEVDPRQFVALTPPAVLDHAAGKHDHVARDLPTIDRQATESIPVDPTHPYAERRQTRPPFEKSLPNVPVT
jgi:hypothetical protein